MARLVAAFSMSLDGFVAGPGIGTDAPMGHGGEALHDWMSTPDEVDGSAMERHMARVGAVILGRTTYDVGRAHWSGTPYPAPGFVLTHRPAAPDTGFTFLSGLEEAVGRARASAGDRDIVVMGASVGRQCLAAGLVAELSLQIVPVLLGAGARLFEPGDVPRHLSMVSARPSRAVIHAIYEPRLTN